MFSGVVGGRGAVAGMGGRAGVGARDLVGVRGPITRQGRITIQALTHTIIRHLAALLRRHMSVRHRHRRSTRL